MINAHDITALTNLLQRTPMSPAETIYASGLLERLAEQIQVESVEPVAPVAPPTTDDAPPPPEPIAPLRPGPLAGY